MRNIKEKFILENKIILVCEMFKDSEITDTLQVDNHIINNKEFIVEKAKACFGEPETRNIVVLNKQLDDELKKFEFIK